jgi:hypothetical protein
LEKPGFYKATRNRDNCAWFSARVPVFMQLSRKSSIGQERIGHKSRNNKFSSLFLRPRATEGLFPKLENLIASKVQNKKWE